MRKIYLFLLVFVLETVLNRIKELNKPLYEKIISDEFAKLKMNEIEIKSEIIKYRNKSDTSNLKSRFFEVLTYVKISNCEYIKQTWLNVSKSKIIKENFLPLNNQ